VVLDRRRSLKPSQNKDRNSHIFKVLAKAIIKASPVTLFPRNRTPVYANGNIETKNTDAQIIPAKFFPPIFSDVVFRAEESDSDDESISRILLMS
jgi:hypothetical protein